MKANDYFKKELNYLKKEEMKEAAVYLIEKLPSYFFEIPASSTGKYHPSYAVGEGGLLRHTKAAVRIAYELLNDPVIQDKYTQEEQDIMLLALMIHDGLKSGKEHSKYTKFDHPLLVVGLIEEEKEHLKLNESQIELLKKVIASHMGPWNKDFDGNEILPVPQTKYEKFVHMCDYLASRKCILIPFDEKNEVVD